MSTASGCSSSPAIRTSRPTRSASAPGTSSATRRSGRGTSRSARPFEDEPKLFAAPLVQRRDGTWAFVGFLNQEPEGILSFDIVDPIPVELAGGTLRRSAARQREGCRGLRTRRCSRRRGHTARCDPEERQLRTAARARAADGGVAGAADRGALDGLLDRRGDRGRDRLAPAPGHPADPRPGRQPAALLRPAAPLDARVRRRRGGDAGAVAGLRAAGDTRVVLGGVACLRPAGGLRRRGGCRGRRRS